MNKYLVTDNDGIDTTIEANTFGTTGVNTVTFYANGAYVPYPQNEDYYIPNGEQGYFPQISVAHFCNVRKVVLIDEIS